MNPHHWPQNQTIMIVLVIGRVNIDGVAGSLQFSYDFAHKIIHDTFRFCDILVQCCDSVQCLFDYYSDEGEALLEGVSEEMKLGFMLLSWNQK